MPLCKVGGGPEDNIRMIPALGFLDHEAAEDGAGFDSKSLAGLDVLAGVADDPIMAGEIGDVLPDEIFF